MSTDSPPQAARLSVADLFAEYSAPPEVYDELKDESSILRPHWTTYVEAISSTGLRELSRRWTHAQRLLHENSIAFSAFGDPQDAPRPWELDPIPAIIPTAEWPVIAKGLIQRARLLEALLADIYGPQRILQKGLVPPLAIFGHPGFLPSFHGLPPSGGRYLHLYAADLARSPDGRWWVMADRTEAPSGLGYALENRLVISRMQGEAFRQLNTQRLASFFLALQENLRQIAPLHQENPRIVYLSQGPASQNYFEDAYLARYLGCTLAEIADLTVRDRMVMLKTVDGLLPVDVILRRPNSEHCDPLELSDAGGNGLAGLLGAIRDGNVAVANSIGSGIVESPLFMAYLPVLCQELLGEKLILPSLATWWGGEVPAKNNLLQNLPARYLSRAYRRRGEEAGFHDELKRLPPKDLRSRIETKPHEWVGQEKVLRSSLPCWERRRLAPAYLAVRAFVTIGDDTATVMQGGLARTSQQLDTLEASLLSGEGSKDAWVLAEGPVEEVTLLRPSGVIPAFRRGGNEVPSRVADALLWFGRYIERADAAARLLRTVALRLSSENGMRYRRELPQLLRALAALGQIEPGYVVEGVREQLPEIEEALPGTVLDTTQPESLASVIQQLIRVGSLVRDRMSLDSWGVLRRIDGLLVAASAEEQNLTSLLDITNEIIMNLSALGGLATESMTRAQPFRFLDIGRRLEKAMQIVTLMRICFVETEGTSNELLEALLETADSHMTYRARYLANINVAAVWDLLLADESNPRSLAYQLDRLSENIVTLQKKNTEAGISVEERLSYDLVHAVRMADMRQLAEEFFLGDRELLENLLSRLESGLPALARALNHKYLVHAAKSHYLQNVTPRQVKDQTKI